MQFRQETHQDQRARYSQHKPGESPPPRARSSGDWFANSRARGFDSRIHEHGIEGFEEVVGPGRNDHLRIRLCAQLGWSINFLKETCQHESRWPVLAQL